MSIQKLAKVKASLFVLVLVLLVAQGCRSKTPAVVVNGHEVSMSVLEDDLVGLLEAEAISANPDFSVNGRPTPSLAAEWVNVLVAQQAFVQLLAARELEVADTDLEAAEAQMDPTLVDQLTTRAAEILNFQTAAFLVLSEALALENPGADPAENPAQLLVQDYIKQANVSIDPRYGVRWDSETAKALVIAAPEVRAGRGPSMHGLPESPVEIPQG